MPQVKPPQVSNSELLDDIDYVNKANIDEIIKVNNQIRQRISETDLSGNVANSIIEEVSSLLGQLTMKVNLAEKAIRSIQPRKKQVSPTLSKKHDATSNRIAQRFSVDQLTGNGNLLPIEHSSDGTSYAWSSSAPEIVFTFPLDRSDALGMQIRLVALIKPEYSKQLKVLVDEKHIRHKFYLDKGLFILSCNIPPSSKASLTEVKIVLPATHTPKDLGTSTDTRSLGIAITEIRFDRPVSGFVHLLKRLKLTS